MKTTPFFLRWLSPGRMLLAECLGDVEVEAFLVMDISRLMERFPMVEVKETPVPGVGQARALESGKKGDKIKICTI